LLISNHDSFRVLFDKTASVQSILFEKHVYTGWPAKTSRNLRNYNGAYTLWAEISFGTFVDQYVLLLTYKFQWRHWWMPHYDVRRVSRQWFRLHARQRSITLRQSNSKFSSRQHARFHQLTRMDTAFARFESARLLSLGYLARTCLRRKAWTISECQIFRMLSETNGTMSMTRQSEKLYCSGNGV